MQGIPIREKRFIVPLITVLMLMVISSPLLAAEDESLVTPVRVTFNGNYLISDVEPLIVEGRTMLPLQLISEELGALVLWDDESHKITVKDKNKLEIALVRDCQQATVKGEKGSEEKNLDAAPFSKDDCTMVPLRFIAENLGLKVDWDEAERTVLLTGSLEGNAKVNCSLIQSKSESLDVKLHIPLLEGLEKKEIEDRINARLDKEAGDFKESIASGVDEYREAAKKGGWPAHPYTVYTSFRVFYNQNNLLSLTVDYYGYTGGAHGMTQRGNYLFDLQTGKELNLEDLFKAGSNYKEIINQEIKKQMQAEKELYFEEALEEWEGISEDQGFYIKDKSIVLYFPLYEIAPYCAGIPEFEIPLSLFDGAMLIHF